MNQNHVLAVVMANSMNSIRELDFSKFDLANRFLKSSKEPEMTKREFDKALALVQKNFVGFGENGVEFQKRKAKQMTDADNAKVLGGKSLFLYHYPAWRRLKKVIEVEFNYDGKGGIRFEDGTTTSDSLVSVVRKITKDNGLEGVSHASEITKAALKVRAKRHPEVGRKNTLNIKDYVTKYC